MFRTIFRFIALGAILATVIAIILITLGIAQDIAPCRSKVVNKPPITFTGLLSTYCTMSFAYGAHGAFPTIQNDMKRPERFPISIVITYVGNEIFDELN